MTTIKLEDVLKVKKPGDEWYAFEAPEELHYWVKKHKWSSKIFRDNDLSIAAIKVEAKAQTGKGSVEKFSTKQPMRLACGVELKGQYGTTVNKKGIFEGRIDGIVELNDTMVELSEFTGFTVWDVRKLEVYHGTKGATLTFSMHNPDSNGTSLYLQKVFRDGQYRMYYDVMVNEQMELIGNFKNNLAHCTAAFVEAMMHSCAIRKKLKKNQIVRRRPVSGE